MPSELIWRNTPDLAASGNILRVSDEFKTFYANLPADMSMRDGCIEFVWSYDFDDYMGNIYCRAALMEKGRVLETMRFDFRDGSSHIEFGPITVAAAVHLRDSSENKDALNGQL